MADMNKVLGQLLSGGAASGFAGGLAGGLASSLLTGKKSRKLSKKVLKMGGMAAVGALAYGAYQRYNAGKTAAPQAARHSTAEPLVQPPQGSAFMPPPGDRSARQQLGLTLVRAMIAAARCDGLLDAQESQAIFQRIHSLDIAPEDRDLLVQEMGKPVDIDAIVASATTPEVAAEIYVASLLAIDVDTVAEKSYLDMLAARLQLPQDLVAELHAQVESETVGTAG